MSYTKCPNTESHFLEYSSATAIERMSVYLTNSTDIEMATIAAGPQVVASANERERRSTPKSALNIHPSSQVMKDIEGQTVNETEKSTSTAKQSAFKTLGWLDRFLAIWIFLAMAIGIILGNFVENAGPALQKGKFVGVSIPIGNFSRILMLIKVLRRGTHADCD